MSNTESLIEFEAVRFAWPVDNAVSGPDAAEQSGAAQIAAEQAAAAPVFSDFSAVIPGGFVSLVGSNGVGKSTFLLLAGGRLLPEAGRIVLAGQDTRFLTGLWASPDGGGVGPGLTDAVQHRRNLLCSFLYQNMEFEDDGEAGKPLGNILEYVYINGGHRSKDELFYRTVLETFEIEALTGRSLTALSKGEIQRVLLAFSALYGSRIIMMDEPLFAMESRQKERALDFFKSLHRETGVSVFVSLHELPLTRKYADTVLLFYPDHRIELGTPAEVLLPESLEAAYGVPAAMLHEAENLQRNHLLEREAQK